MFPETVGRIFYRQRRGKVASERLVRLLDEHEDARDLVQHRPIWAPRPHPENPVPRSGAEPREDGRTLQHLTVTGIRWNGDLVDRLWRRLAAASGDGTGPRTLLVVSHRNAALQKADQIVVLDRGRVVGTGSRDHLLSTSAELRRLWSDEAVVEAEESL